MLIPVFVEGDWAQVLVHDTCKEVTLTLTERQDRQAVEGIVKTWIKRELRDRNQHKKVVVRVQTSNKARNILAWMTCAMFDAQPTILQREINTFVVQSILRGSCGWTEPKVSSETVADDTDRPSTLSSSNGDSEHEKIDSASITELGMMSKDDELALIVDSTIGDLYDRGWEWEEIMSQIEGIDDPELLRKWVDNWTLSEFETKEPDKDWNMQPDIIESAGGLKGLVIKSQNLGGQGMRKG